ncbi:unnamed protein product, partial [Cyprideis torosa]
LIASPCFESLGKETKPKARISRPPPSRPLDINPLQLEELRAMALLLGHPTSQIERLSGQDLLRLVERDINLLSRAAGQKALKKTLLGTIS